MGPDELIALLDDLDEAGATYWLDGGWGVDALLGEQTREHGDVDVVVHRSDLTLVRSLLEAQGYGVLRDWLPVALALRHPDGREVDLHPVDPTPEGGGDQVVDASGATWHYAAPVSGSVCGRRVSCCSAEDQVAMRLGYEPRERDRADVRRLVERYGVSPPAEWD